MTTDKKQLLPAEWQAHYDRLNKKMELAHKMNRERCAISGRRDADSRGPEFQDQVRPGFPGSRPHGNIETEWNEWGRASRSLRENIHSAYGHGIEPKRYAAYHVLSFLSGTTTQELSPLIDFPGELSVENFLDRMINGEPEPTPAGRLPSPAAPPKLEI